MRCVCGDCVYGVAVGARSRAVAVVHDAMRCCHSTYCCCTPARPTPGYFRMREICLHTLVHACRSRSRRRPPIARLDNNYYSAALALSLSAAAGGLLPGSWRSSAVLARSHRIHTNTRTHRHTFLPNYDVKRTVRQQLANTSHVAANRSELSECDAARACVCS